MKRRRKKINEPRAEYGRGALRGYAEYRYGDRSIYAPGKDPVVRKVISGDQREHVVGRVLDGLKQWRSSKFEFEGAARAGLRSGLCLAGYDWHRADLVAADITEDCLRQMGAERPTHEQGQPEYLDRHIYCATCHGPLDDEHLTGNRSSRFCSIECAKAMRVTEHYRQRPKTDRLRRYAEGMIYRAKQAKRSCAECGDEFQPQSEGKPQRFCSLSCAAKNRTRGWAETGFPSICAMCGDPFTAGNTQGQICSEGCAKALRKLKRGHEPAKLTRRTFDHFLVLPIDEEWRRRLTPQKLDWFFMEAGRTITGEATVPRVTDGLFGAA